MLRCLLIGIINDLQAVYEGHPGQRHIEHPGGSPAVVDVWAEQYYGTYHTTYTVSPVPNPLSSLNKHPPIAVFEYIRTGSHILVPPVQPPSDPPEFCIGLDLHSYLRVINRSRHELMPKIHGVNIYYVSDPVSREASATFLE